MDDNVRGLNARKRLLIQPIVALLLGLDRALGIIIGPQIITKPKHVCAHQFVHVRLFAEAREQTEFVGLACEGLLRPLF